MKPRKNRHVQLFIEQLEDRYAPAYVDIAPGGVLGALIGIGIVFCAPWVSEHLFGKHLPAQLNTYPIVLAMSVSIAVGVVFGLYPAFRASRLDPIEALRHD
jgi:putative ABC transport system permease protein